LPLLRELKNRWLRQKFRAGWNKKSVRTQNGESAVLNKEESRDAKTIKCVPDAGPELSYSTDESSG
jgi:hypothetical protein